MNDNYSLLVDVRRNTFDLAVICVYLLTILVFLGSNTLLPYISDEQIQISIALMVISGVALGLRYIHFNAAIYFLLVGLWLCVIFAMLKLHYAGAPYLFAVVVLLAGNLSTLWGQLLFTVGSSAALLLLSSPTADPVAFWGAVLFIWINQIFSYCVSRGLLQALEISQHYQKHAVEQMNKAREQRGEMARITEVLQASKQNLQRLNIQLRHARDSAKEARRLKAQFAANVSHELRTPINLIVGFSEVMATAPEVYGHTLPSVYRADIQAIYRNARHLQGLINDILDISQIEAAQLAMVKEEADPKQVIDEAVRMAESLVESKGLQFRVYVPDDLPNIRMDRTRIRQVLLNLLANSVRFTERGTITLRARLDEAHLVIAVSDTGIGIPHDELAHVFEEFYQVDGNFSRKQGGTGLGLALSKQFVTLHGGHMWAESAGIAGKGSIFTFTLPLAEGSYTLPREISSDDSADQAVHHVIVWDDDPAIIQLFRGYTRKHRVLSTPHLDEVCRWVEQQHPLAVIAAQDADTDRLERYLAANHPATTLITCPMPSGRRAMQAIGLHDYLVKPVSREAVLETLDKLGPDVHRLLLIDDEPDILRMLTRFLQSAPRPYAVRLASSGQEGLELMRQFPPDAVMLDIRLPDLDGFLVVEHMRADPQMQEIPVIAISGQGPHDAIAPVVSGKMTLWKESGFQPIELVQCVEALVAQLIPPAGPKSPAKPCGPAVS